MKWKWKKFIVKLKWAFSNPLTIRDISLGLLINAMFDIANKGFSEANTLVLIFAIYVIIEVNYKLRKGK